MMLVRGIGIRDIAEIEKISIWKVLSVLVNSRHSIRPKQTYNNMSVWKQMNFGLMWVKGVTRLA
jgi:phage antirepressor YoqD-like protein